MGDVAELMLDGSICQICGEGMGAAPCGYPRTCRSCLGEIAAVAAEPQPQEVADYLRAAEAHGWTSTTHNNGWHIVLRRGHEQLNLWLGARRAPHWSVQYAKGHAKPVQQGLLQAITEEKV